MPYKIIEGSVLWNLWLIFFLSEGNYFCIANYDFCGVATIYYQHKIIAVLK